MASGRALPNRRPGTTPYGRLLKEKQYSGVFPDGEGV